MSQFRLIEQWTEETETPGVWTAAAEAYPQGPMMVMIVSQLENSRWQYSVWYAYDPLEKWTQDGFESAEGAKASAELKVHRLQGGGGR